MDLQPAHQATSTTYARPRQLADSPAAALPTETLQHILQLALQGEEDPFERQSTKRSFSKVCYHWYTVVPSPTEYAVSSATEARRLALKLKQADKQGGKMRSIAIRLDATHGVNRSGKTAWILDACRNVEHLAVDLESPLCIVYDPAGSFGTGLFRAMKKLSGLRVLELYNQAFVTPPVLAEMFKAWALLHSLRINSRLATHPWQRVSSASLGTASALRHLDISGDVDLIHHLLPHLRRSKVPLSLVVRKWPGDEPLPAPDMPSRSASSPTESRCSQRRTAGFVAGPSTRCSPLSRKRKPSSCATPSSRTPTSCSSFSNSPSCAPSLSSARPLRPKTDTSSGSSPSASYFQSLALPRQLAQLWTPTETKAVETRAEQPQFEVVST